MTNPEIPVAVAPGPRTAWRRFGAGPSGVTIRPRAWYFLPLPIAVFWGVHVVMAMAAYRSPVFSTAWALVVLLGGLAAVSKEDSAAKVAVVVAYVAGAELIWRGTHSMLFWEYGKYVSMLLMGLSLVKNPPRGPVERRAIVFAACLAPSMAILPYFDRQEVAFNISGPVALAIAVLFFNGMPISRGRLVKMCVVFLGPVVGLAALAMSGTLAADPSTFRVGLKATTAGIGPNQVSSVLGLGVFLAFVLLLVGLPKISTRVLIGGTGIWLVAQTLLSFSRGGLWTAAGAIFVVSLHLLRLRRTRLTLLVGALLGFLAIELMVIPLVDQISHGLVSRRFTETNLTGRGKIMKADLLIFLGHPLFGVGPGQSYELHALTYRPSSPHTEFTRLLAEHGIFGVVAIGMLSWMAWDRWRRKTFLLPRALALGLTAWTLLYMGHSAMRLSAPAFCFGLGAARLLAEETRRRVRRRWVIPQPSGTH